MLSCRDLIAELSNLVDNDVAAEVRRELEEHLTHCRTCQVLYDSTRQTIRVLTDVGSFELPESLAARIRQRVMAEIRSR
jgi:anti-sigma factor RsiW